MPSKLLNVPLLVNEQLQQLVNNIVDDLDAEQQAGAAGQQDRVKEATQVVAPHAFGVDDRALDRPVVQSELSPFDARILTSIKNLPEILMLGMIGLSCIYPLALLIQGLKTYNDAYRQAETVNTSGDDLDIANANAKTAYYIIQGFLATNPLLAKIIIEFLILGLVFVDPINNYIGVGRDHRKHNIDKDVPSTQQERIANNMEAGGEREYYARLDHDTDRGHNKHTFSYWLLTARAHPILPNLQECIPVFVVAATTALATANTQVIYTANETYNNFATNLDKQWTHVRNTIEECKNVTMSDPGQYDTCDAKANQNAAFLTTKQTMDNIANVTWNALAGMGSVLVVIAVAELLYYFYELRAGNRNDRKTWFPVFTAVREITGNSLMYLIASYAAFAYMTQSQALVDGMPKYDDWYDVLSAFNREVLGISDTTLARSQSAALTVGYLNGEPLHNAVMVSEGILAVGLIDIVLRAAIQIFNLTTLKNRLHNFTHKRPASWLPSLATFTRIVIMIAVAGILIDDLVIALFGRDAYIGKANSKYNDEKTSGICTGSAYKDTKCHANANADGLANLFEQFAELLSGNTGVALLYGPVVGLAVFGLVYAIASCCKQPTRRAENVNVELPNFVGERLVVAGQPQLNQAVNGDEVVNPVVANERLRDDDIEMALRDDVNGTNNNTAVNGSTGTSTVKEDVAHQPRRKNYSNKARAVQFAYDPDKDARDRADKDLDEVFSMQLDV